MLVAIANLSVTDANFNNDVSWLNNYLRAVSATTLRCTAETAPNATFIVIGW